MSWLDDVGEWLSDTGDALARTMFQGDWSSSRPPRDPIAENQMPREDPAIQSEINRLRGIASGAVKDPGAQMLEDQARRSGQQAYGLAQGLGMQNAATRQRLAQGGRGATLRELPEMRQAATIDAKQAAAAKLTEALAQRRALEEEKIQERKKQELQKEIDRASKIEQDKEATASFLSSIPIIGGPLAKLADLSDEKLKENIAPAGRDTRQFIDSLEPKRFNYKGADPRSPQLGILANDVDGDPVVNMGTREDPVLGLDRQKTRSALLASVGKLGQENRQLATALTDLDGKLKYLADQSRFELTPAAEAQKALEERRSEIIRRASNELFDRGPAAEQKRLAQKKKRDEIIRRAGMVELRKEQEREDRAFEEIMKAQENEALKSIGQGILDEKRRKGY